jgi:hypothetical protein
VLQECLAILNSFLIQFPQATPVFISHKEILKEKLSLVQQEVSNQKLVQTAFRFLKNLLELNIVQ